jgi:hypothetical protein
MPVELEGEERVMLGRKQDVSIREQSRGGADEGGGLEGLVFRGYAQGGGDTEGDVGYWIHGDGGPATDGKRGRRDTAVRKACRLFTDRPMSGSPLMLFRA